MSENGRTIKSGQMAKLTFEFEGKWHMHSGVNSDGFANYG